MGETVEGVISISIQSFSCFNYNTFRVRFPYLPPNPKSMKSLIRLLNERFIEERNLDRGERSVGFDIRHKSYIIDFYATVDDIEIVIHNVNYPHREYPNVADILEQNVIYWHDVKFESDTDIWDEHGFSSHQDFLNYKYG